MKNLSVKKLTVRFFKRRLKTAATIFLLPIFILKKGMDYYETIK